MSKEKKFNEYELCVDLDKADYYEKDERLHIMMNKPDAIEHVKKTCNGECDKCGSYRNEHPIKGYDAYVSKKPYELAPLKVKIPYDFIEKNADKINWKKCSKQPNSNEDFKTRFMRNAYLYMVLKYSNLSDEIKKDIYDSIVN